MINKNNPEYKKLRLKSFLIYHLGPIDGLKRFRKYGSANGKLSWQIFLLGKIDGQKAYDERCKKLSFSRTKEGYIEKYGEEIGIAKYLEKNSKLSVGVAALQKNGYSDEEIKQIKQKHSSNSTTSLENMIKRYGEFEGKKRFEEFINNNFFSCRSIDSWLKRGLTEEEASQAVKKVQTRNLDFFKQKYGEEKAVIKWLNSNKKKAFANTEEYYIDKYGELDGYHKYNEVLKKRIAPLKLEYWENKYGAELGKQKWLDSKVQTIESMHSAVEIEFVSLLYSLLPKDNLKFVGHPINEIKALFFKKNEFNINLCVPDVIINDKIIVEFDGDYWHSLPENVQRDKGKNVLYERRGFHLIRVKEKDYRRDKEECLNNTVQLILQQVQK